MTLLDQSQLRDRVERLAAIERGSASSGEARAAELIAAELRDAGAEVVVEHERAHGTYWWPVGLLTAKAGLAGLMRGRWRAVLAGAFATAAVTDDITGGSQWFRRRFLPRGMTTNVVARMGDPGAEHTVVVHAHHDAAHTGLVFDGGPPRALLKRFPALAEKANTTPPTMWGAVGGPALVAVGALLGLRRVRRAGVVLCAGYAAAMADIGARQVVPGANDNLSGVAVLLSLARSLRDEPVPGVRVILLSAGSEESFMEGMQAFARRHFGDLPRERTTFLCLDTVGSPHLLALEGEGMVWMNDYPRGRARPGARRRRGGGRRAVARAALSQRHRRADPASRGLPDRHAGLLRPVQAAHELPLAHRHGGPAGLLDRRGLRPAGTTRAHNHPDFLKVRNSVRHATSITVRIAG